MKLRITRSATLSLLLLISGLFFLHCNRVIDDILPHTELIFPSEPGKFRISLVIDTTYNSAGPVVDTYYKKSELEGTEVDLTGRTVRKLQTYRSDISLGSNYNFIPYRLYTQYIDSAGPGTRYAELIEENNRFLVLKFPVSPGISWNGNLYNILGTQEYTYSEVDSTVTVQGKTYENCVVVIQKDNQDGLIRKEFAYEIYAPNIGLIKKFDQTLVFDGANGEFNPSESYIFQEEMLENN